MNRTPLLLLPVLALVVAALPASLTAGGSGGANLQRGAGQPYLVKDINSVPMSTDPQELVTVSNVVFFVGFDPNHGRELWRSDGTAAGTTLLKDILPGKADSGIRSMTPIGNLLIFVAKDSKHGTELWKSDGTAS